MAAAFGLCAPGSHRNGGRPCRRAQEAVDSSCENVRLLRREIRRFGMGGAATGWTASGPTQTRSKPRAAALLMRFVTWDADGLLAKNEGRSFEGLTEFPLQGL